MTKYVTGDAALRRAFRQMGKNLQRPINEASRFAMQPILSAAKANTPHASIKKALTLKVDRKAPKTNPTTVVGGKPGAEGTPLLHLQEFGVEPHKIGDIQHPGHVAQPFLTPAFEAHGEEAIKRFEQKLGSAIEAQAARLAAKGGK